VEAQLSEAEPINLSRSTQSGKSSIVYLYQNNRSPRQTSFDRHELRQILNVYCTRVAAGEWRDYAIDTLKERAVFSIFRHSSEVPLYRIEKRPKMARKQGLYWIISASGMILKRGHDLNQVLKAIDRRPKLSLI
jgi:Protein of unknown function (DUF2794)